MSRRNRRRRTPEQRQDARRKFVRNWIVAPLRIMLLAVLGVAMGFGGYRVAVYLRTSSALAVRCIEVQGTVHTDADEITRCADLSEGQNIFSIDLERARKKIEQQPWIRKATVQRMVPDRIVIEVVEQEAAALISLDGLYLVNERGEVFKRVQPGELMDLPIITGISRDDFNRAPELAEKRIRDSLSVMDLVEKTVCLANRRLAEVHHDEVMGTSLVLDPGALVVRMGRDSSAKRMGTLCLLLGELNKHGIDADELIMDDDVHPDRAVIRLARIAVANTNENNGNNRI